MFNNNKKYNILNINKEIIIEGGGGVLLFVADCSTVWYISQLLRAISNPIFLWESAGDSYHT